MFTRGSAARVSRLTPQHWGVQKRRGWKLREQVHEMARRTAATHMEIGAYNTVPLVVHKKVTFGVEVDDATSSERFRKATGRSMRTHDTSPPPVHFNAMSRGLVEHRSAMMAKDNSAARSEHGILLDKIDSADQMVSVLSKTICSLLNDPNPATRLSENVLTWIERQYNEARA
jgi:hypothetical protein